MAAINAISPWRTLKSEKIYENRWFALRQDRVCTHAGDEITYTFMEHPGAVAVVPILGDGRIVLMRQYRYTVKDWCWEVPMGARNHEDLEVVARQELLEEVGGVTDDLRFVASFYANNGVSDICCTVFLALDVKLGANYPEPGELIEVTINPADETMRMARAGEISDGMSALALFLCEPYFPVQG